MQFPNLVRMAALASCLLPQIASAEAAFPARPITIIVPTAAGGAADGAARNVASELSALAKQPVVVDNRPGAGGTIAAVFAAPTRSIAWCASSMTTWPG